MPSELNSAGAPALTQAFQLSRSRNGSQASSADAPIREPRLSSKESRLLLYLAGGRETEASIRELLEEGIEWERLFELSVREHTQPFVGRRLQQLGGEVIPAKVRDALTGIERIAEFRHRYLQRRFTDALEVLSAAEIPVVLLKGSGLASTAYGSFTDRPMGDIDLLVKPEQAQRAFTLLTEAGWVRRFEARFDSLYTEMHHLPPLIDGRVRSLSIGLEIHTELIPPTRNPFNFSAAEIWKSCQSVRGLPPGVYVPSALNSLLHCCIHFVWSHMFLRSAWRTFHDIAALFSRGNIDWAEFAEHARAARAASCCYWALRMARATALVPVPEEVLQRLRPNGPNKFLNLLELHLLLQLVEAEQSCPSRRLHYWVWTAAVQPDSMQLGRHRPWDYDGDHWAMIEANRVEEGSQPRRRRLLPSAKAWVKYLKSVA